MAETGFLYSSISNNGFWPDVPVRQFIEGWRVPQDTNNGMVRCVLVSAIQTTNIKCAEIFAARSLSATFSALCAAHELDQIDGEYQAVNLYLAAVYNLAKAQTLPLLQSVRPKPVAEGESNATDNQEQVFLNNHQSALSNLFAEFGLKLSSNEGAYFASIGYKPS